MRSLARLTVAGLMVVTGVGLTMLPTSTTATAEPTPKADSSAMTVKGKNRFSDLEVSVDQTRDLINQTVHIRWKGGKPTDNPPGKNFLQIMQCWGDDARGPDREQCQYGAPVIDFAGEQIESRTLSYYPEVKDPDETVPNGATFGVVPFRSVTGKITSSTVPDYEQFFDSQNTNEVSVAATQEDGSGSIDFEVLTGLEAHGLGCGKLRTEGPEAGKPRSCWLVIVPRDDIEVTGKQVGVPGGHIHNYLDSSPLSKRNFKEALVVPLKFLAVGDSCPIGSAERALSGNELISDAVIRWQPALCAGNGPVFGFAQVADRLVRDQMVSPEPGMVFTSKPLDPAQVPADRKMVYAPVAVSSYTVAFIMERQASISAPPDILKQNGQIITELNLTPRLMAKLLTQSYGGAVYTKEDYLSKNPRRLVEDKEFLALNPVFKDYGFSMHTVEPLLTSVDSDATESMWAWINQDAEARAFLDGSPDPDNMVVNKNYRGLALPVDHFPRADTSCIILDLLGRKVPKCTLNSRGMAADLHQAGRAASRGDSLQKEPQAEPDPLDPTKPLYKKNERTRNGARALIAIVDSATADRYGLPVAKLRNAAGNFVSPKDAGAVQAGVDGMTKSAVDGVLLTNPAVKTPNAYPLPLVTYAAAAPATMDTAAGKDYATFLRYATGPGQTPGDGIGALPIGYLPLTPAMTTQATDAAATIERDAGKKIVTTTTPPAEQSGESSSNGGNTGGSGNSGTPGGQAPAPGGAPVPAPAPPAVAAPAAVEARPAAAARDTPSLAVSWQVRYLLAALLVMGGLATGGGPLLMRLGARATESGR
ncbi:hypothetical protein [Alloactinosynnema sp. L-07]|nr:hypothetical protein [Alloactinosynnema sp. L-07]